MLSIPSNFLSLLPPLLLIIFLIKWLFTIPPTRKTTPPPPSPPKLPIIGNFHQLGTLPHRSLSTLAQRYGPLMLLHLGNIPTLVVSSPVAAIEIMKTHDLAFANRPDLQNLKKLLGMKDVAVSPYGEHWKQLKGIFVHQLLSKKRVQSYRLVREEETDVMIRKINESCLTSSTPVNLRDLFVTLSNDVGCRAAFGRKYTGGENGEKLMALLNELLELVGTFCIGDYVPWLGWLDRLTGTDARVDRVVKGLDEFLEGVIEERLALLQKREQDSELNPNPDQYTEDFIDILLKIEKNENNGISLDRATIKAMLLDAYSGGTDTTSTFLEWAMSELLRNPESMKKLQSEVRLVLGGRNDIAKVDLDKMPYLKAIIKETYRLHPPVALHTRSPKQDIKVMGYDIAAGTMVLINNWHLANDPNLWDRPEDFSPERFLDSDIDYKGHDFHFLPFGAGRRLCPGMYFASALIEYVLANLVHKFEWELPKGIGRDDLDMTECLGAVIHRKIPLQAIAIPF